jgi:ribonuclease HI
MMRSFLVYADGSCNARDRVGAFAYVCVDEEDVPALYEGESYDDTTISRMELSGPAAALERLHAEYGECVVLVLSDSQYVVKGISDPSRKRNLHHDLWLRLEEAIRLHGLVAFEHVKGHAGHFWNEAVDKLAGELRKEKLSEVDYS